MKRVKQKITIASLRWVCILSLLSIHNLQNKCVSSRKGKLYLPCPPSPSNSPNSHSRRESFRRHMDFSCMKKINVHVTPKSFQTWLDIFIIRIHSTQSSLSLKFLIYGTGWSHIQMLYKGSIYPSLVQWDWTVGGMSNENQKKLWARRLKSLTKGSKYKLQKGQVPVHITQWHLPEQQADYSPAVYQ